MSAVMLQVTADRHNAVNNYAAISCTYKLLRNWTIVYCFISFPELNTFGNVKNCYFVVTLVCGYRCNSAIAAACR